MEDEQSESFLLFTPVNPRRSEWGFISKEIDSKGARRDHETRQEEGTVRVTNEVEGALGATF